MWYSLNIYNDENEKFENELNITEYLASFWNPESVKKIKQERNLKKENDEISAEEFIKTNNEAYTENESLINAISLMRKLQEEAKNNAGSGSINLNKLIKDKF
jgi:hypothetical protein